MDFYLTTELERLKKIADLTDDMQLSAELSEAISFARQTVGKLSHWEDRCLRALLRTRLAGVSTDKIKKALHGLEQGQLWD